MEELVEKIEVMREKMHKIALEKGISHPEVLQASQELDKLINLFSKKSSVFLRTRAMEGDVQSF